MKVVYFYSFCKYLFNLCNLVTSVAVVTLSIRKWPSDRNIAKMAVQNWIDILKSSKKTALIHDGKRRHNGWELVLTCYI